MTYLDTHVLVWLYAGDLQVFPEAVLQQLEQEDDLRFSPMVRLELEYLYEIERISEHAITVLDTLESTLGIRSCDAPFSGIVKEAETIQWTRDPFDRLIVAHASLLDATLITKDQNIHDHYPYAFW